MYIVVMLQLDVPLISADSLWACSIQIEHVYPLLMTQVDRTIANNSEVGCARLERVNAAGPVFGVRPLRLRADRRHLRVVASSVRRRR